MGNLFWLKHARLLKKFGSWFKDDACDDCRNRCILKYQRGDELDFDKDICDECKKHPVVQEYVRATKL